MREDKKKLIFIYICGILSILMFLTIILATFFFAFIFHFLIMMGLLIISFLGALNITENDLKNKILNRNHGKVSFIGFNLIIIGGIVATFSSMILISNSINIYSGFIILFVIIGICDIGFILFIIPIIKK